MKYIVSLFTLVFVYSKVSRIHFLHVFKNRGRTSLPPLLNLHLLICSTKVRFLVHSILFIGPRNFPNALYSPKLLSGTLLHNFVENGISKDEEKLFQLLSKKVAVLTLFRMGLFGAAHGWGRKCPPA